LPHFNNYYWHCITSGSFFNGQWLIVFRHNPRRWTNLSKTFDPRSNVVKTILGWRSSEDQDEAFSPKVRR
jgi:hypothetical protein